MINALKYRAWRQNQFLGILPAFPGFLHKRCQQLPLRLPFPHTPGARMTVVKQTPPWTYSNNTQYSCWHPTWMRPGTGLRMQVFTPALGCQSSIEYCNAYNTHGWHECKELTLLSQSLFASSMSSSQAKSLASQVKAQEQVNP